MFKQLFNRLSYISALIIKEFQIIWSDPRNRIMILLPPLLQLTIFAFTATFEVKNISMVIYDKDNSIISRSLSDKFQNTPTVHTVYHVNNESDFKNLIDTQKVYLGLTIPPDFSRNLYAQKPAILQFILDGRKSNAAQIVMGYSTQIVNAFQYELNDISIPKPKITIDIRHWFNPNLNYQWFIIISLTGAIATIMMLAITALAVAQEKEQGTFDQIIVAPLSSTEILIGKTIPALLIALLDVSLMIGAGLLFFDLPLSGSFVSLYLSIIVFLISIAGIGLFISTLCQTQQQAILGVFAFFAPTFLLSGFVAPIENMPLFLQKLSIINPLTYFFNLMKGIFLKDISIPMIWENIIPLLIISIITLTFADWFFNKKLD